MVSKDHIRRIEDLILGQSKDITYYNVCKKLKPIKEYKYELEDVYKKISEVAPDAQPSLEKLLDRMKKIDYSLISGNIIREYGFLICPTTEIFYYGILKGIDSAVCNKQENINNLKIALEYLASGDILERFFKTYLKEVEEKFHKETEYTISGLAEIAYKIAEFLSVRGFRNTNRNIKYLLNIKAKNAVHYLDTFSDLAWEESEKVANIVENLVKYPEQYKKDFDEYIGYKAEK